MFKIGLFIEDFRGEFVNYVNNSAESMNPIGGQDVAIKEQSKTDVNNMSMFSFSPTILLWCVRTRKR